MLRKGIIAIVEDDNLLALVMTKHLEKEGYRTKSFSRAEDLITFLSNKEPIAIAILDVKLKGMMSGIDLAAILPFDVPVIFCTGNSDQTVNHSGQNSQVIRTLIKPIDLNELTKVISTVVEKE